MKLYKFKSFEDYQSAQEKTNKKKLHAVFVSEDVINVLAKYILDNIEKPSFGICHGTRRGVEQEYFSDKTGAKVIGTEISSTATQFPNTIQWDFHKIKNEWINNVDFIYSNSIDHSYDPKLALSKWLECLRDDGVCFIEYTRHNKLFTKADCFSAEYLEMKSLIEEVGYICDILTIKGHTPMKKRRLKYKVFVIKKKGVKNGDEKA